MKQIEELVEDSDMQWSFMEFINKPNKWHMDILLNCFYSHCMIAIHVHVYTYMYVHVRSYLVIISNNVHVSSLKQMVPFCYFTHMKGSYWHSAIEVPWSVNGHGTLYRLALDKAHEMYIKKDFKSAIVKIITTKKTLFLNYWIKAHKNIVRQLFPELNIYRWPPMYMYNVTILECRTILHLRKALKKWVLKLQKVYYSFHWLWVIKDYNYTEQMKSTQV